MRAELRSAREALENETQAHATILEAYTDLVKRNEERFDDLFQQHSRIVDQKLGVGQASGSGKPTGEIKPIRGARVPWAVTAAKFEAKDRADYWKAHIEQVEKQTGVVNDPAVQTESK